MRQAVPPALLESDPYTPVIKDSGWVRRANCASMPNPEDLFVEGYQAQHEVAKAVCGPCAVRSDCLADTFIRQEVEGVRGGLAAQERTLLHRQYDTEGIITADYKARKRFTRPRSETSNRLFTPISYEPLTVTQLAEIGEDLLSHSLLEALNVLSQGFQLKDHGPFTDGDEKLFQAKRVKIQKTLCNDGNGRKCMEYAIRRGIEERVIPIQVAETAAKDKLQPVHLAILECIAAGAKNQQIATATGLKETRVNAERQFCSQVLASRNAPHTVRRAYEIGAMVIGSDTTTMGLDLQKRVQKYLPEPGKAASDLFTQAMEGFTASAEAWYNKGI